MNKLYRIINDTYNCMISMTLLTVYYTILIILTCIFQTKYSDGCQTKYMTRLILLVRIFEAFLSQIPNWLFSPDQMPF